jgi:hypothetical protein
MAVTQGAAIFVSDPALHGFDPLRDRSHQRKRWRLFFPHRP